MVCVPRLLYSYFTALFILTFSTTCSAQMIRAGSTNFPPFYVINTDYSSSGVYLDIMESTLQHAKFDYRLDAYPAKRLYRNLAQGKTDLFLGIKGSPEYDEAVLYSKTTISKIQLRVYALQYSPLPRTKEELNGYSIITMRGYGYGGLVSYFEDPRNNIKVTTATEHHASFLMLKNKRADYVINYKYPSETALADLDIPAIQYSNLDSSDVHFIISKATPNAEKILHRLEQAYLDLVQKGELEYIENSG